MCCAVLLKFLWSFFFVRYAVNVQRNTKKMRNEESGHCHIKSFRCTHTDVSLRINDDDSDVWRWTSRKHTANVCFEPDVWCLMCVCVPHWNCVISHRVLTVDGWMALSCSMALLAMSSPYRQDCTYPFSCLVIFSFSSSSSSSSSSFSSFAFKLRFNMQRSFDVTAELYKITLKHMFYLP